MAWHHLAHHCADVAACFEALCRLPVVRTRLERAANAPLSGCVLDRLAVLAFLHDAGKLHPGFQGKGWPQNVRKPPPAGHVRKGASLFRFGRPEDLARNLCLEDLIRWGIGAGDLLWAALAHHGRPFLLSTVTAVDWSAVRTPEITYDHVAASRELGAMIRHWFPGAFVPDDDQLPTAAPFQHVFCGLVSLADWIGSARLHISRGA